MAEVRYFEVALLSGDHMLYVASAASAAAKVKAAAVEGLRARNWGDFKPEELEIRTPRGVNAQQLANRWLEHMSDLGETFEHMLAIYDSDDDSEIERLTPKRFRSRLAVMETAYAEVLEFEWTWTMDTMSDADEAIFARVFDEGTARLINRASKAVLSERARMAIERVGEDDAVDELLGRYYVTRGQAQAAVDAVLAESVVG